MRGIIEAQQIERRAKSPRDSWQSRPTLEVGRNLRRPDPPVTFQPRSPREGIRIERGRNPSPVRGTRLRLRTTRHERRPSRRWNPPRPGLRERLRRRVTRTRPTGAALRHPFSITRGHAVVLLAIPVAIVVAGLAVGAIGLFEMTARGSNLALPATAAERLLLTEALPQGRASGEPLSIDASAFEQIRRTEYTVRPGDTISEIAFRFGIQPGTILSMNPVQDVRRLLPGTMLSIPDRDGLFYAVQPGDSLSSISAEFDVPIVAILDANDIESAILEVGDSLFLPGVTMDDDDYLLAIGELFQWPARRFRFTSGFGMRNDPFTGEWRMHSGIDLANVVGTPILAARSGRVAHVDRAAGNYGGLVIIEHANGFQTLYAHLDSVTVRTGQRVVTGEVIGRMGNTGRSTGSHLHFSVIRNRQFVDPMDHMPPR